MGSRFRSTTLAARTAHWGAIGLLWLFAGLAAARAEVAASLDTVKLQLKWRHQFQFAGYYMAKEKGFYKEEGLDVDIVEARPGVNTEDEVLQGKADFGVGTSSLLLLRAQGKPVVVLAVIFQHSPSVLITLDAIRSLQDLVGKKAMIEPNAASNRGLLKRQDMLDRIEIVRHSFDLQDLIAGKVAAQSSFASNEPYVLMKAGIPYRVFSPSDGGVDFYGDNIYTTEQQLARHPARVSAFRRATLRGWQYAIEHVDEAIDITRAKYSPDRSREALSFEADVLIRHMAPELVQLGYMHRGRWRHIADVYAELGMLPAGFDPPGFLYDADPPRDYSWLFWSLAIAMAAIGGAAGLIFFIVRSNRRLAAQIAQTDAMRRIAEQASADKNRFIAAASHDLRQPLHAMGLFVDGLLARPLPERETRIAENLRRSVQTMCNLFAGIMDVARLDAHAIEPVLTDIPLGEMMVRLQREFAPLARQKGLELRAARCCAVVRSDALLLERIVRNLLSNALTHCESGRILLGCRRRGHTLRLEVWDTGPGIAPEHQARIFEEFSQLPGPGIGKGAGLGLAIVERVARILHHPVGLRSRPGKGSVFSVEIPLARIQSWAPDNQPAAPEPDDPLDASVVVIDKDRSILAGMHTVLTSWGCRVHVALSCEDYLARRGRHKPDVIISDHHLGAGADGAQAIARIRASCGDHIPAILVTADTSSRPAEEARAAGAIPMSKPLHMPSLRKALRGLAVATVD